MATIAVEPVAPYKKVYRSSHYDEYDQLYADRMRQFGPHEAFNDYTDGLLDEPYINRHCMLDAISDYRNTELHITRPLHDNFLDVAFNYRPYQKCVIA